VDLESSHDREKGADTRRRVECLVEDEDDAGACAPDTGVADPIVSFVSAHKVDLFFDMVDRLDLHPEATHLHFCGDPKLLFYASTTPPCFSGAVLARFAERATASFAKLIDSDVADIDRTSLHRRNGAAIPDYCSNAQKLYDASLAMTMMDSRPTLVGLFTPSSPPGVIADPDSADATAVGRLEAAEYDAYWTHWTYSSQHVKLTPAEFRIALAARVGTIPRFVYDKEAIRCDCRALHVGASDHITRVAVLQALRHQRGSSTHVAETRHCAQCSESFVTL